MIFKIKHERKKITILLETNNTRCKVNFFRVISLTEEEALCLLMCVHVSLRPQTTQGSGQFEVEVVKVDNPGNRLLSGGCCGAQSSVSSAAGSAGSSAKSANTSDSFSLGSSSDSVVGSTVCRQQCNTAVTMCLRDRWVKGRRRRRAAAYEASSHPQPFVESERRTEKRSRVLATLSSAASPSLSPLSSCTYGHNSSISLGPSSFVLPHTRSSEPHVKVSFTFSWMVSDCIIKKTC